MTPQRDLPARPCRNVASRLLARARGKSSPSQDVVRRRSGCAGLSAQTSDAQTGGRTTHRLQSAHANPRCCCCCCPRPCPLPLLAPCLYPVSWCSDSCPWSCKVRWCAPEPQAAGLRYRIHVVSSSNSIQKFEPKVAPVLECGLRESERHACFRT